MARIYQLGLLLSPSLDPGNIITLPGRKVLAHSAYPVYTGPRSINSEFVIELRSELFTAFYRGMPTHNLNTTSSIDAIIYYAISVRIIKRVNFTNFDILTQLYVIHYFICFGCGEVIILTRQSWNEPYVGP